MLGLLVILLSTAFAAYSQVVSTVEPTKEPTWLLFERGKYAFEQREYGEALRLFRSVKEANTGMPEADIAIGDVFRAEGELDLALLQYQRAYDARSQLQVRDDAIDLEYRMAEIYAMNEAYLQYEDELTSIIDQVDGRYAQPPSNLEDPMIRILTEDGVDKLLELYRIEDRGSQQAYYLLSRYLLYQGRRFSEAASAATYSVIITLSEIVSFARTIDPVYEFSDVQTLLADTDRFQPVRRYVDTTELYEQLFVLGHALDASGRRQPAESVRQLLMLVDPGGPAGQRAARGYAPIP